MYGWTKPDALNALTQPFVRFPTIIKPRDIPGVVQLLSQG